MAKNEQDELGTGATNYAKFTGMAFQMVVIIGLMAFIGYKIDESAGHQTKWVTAVLSLFGVFIALFFSYQICTKLKILPSVYGFILFTLILAITPLYLTLATDGHWLIPHFWIMFAFISGITFLIVVALMATKQINPEKFAQTFLATTVFKLLASLAFMVIFILKTKPNKVVFVVDFFYIYFLNMAFEVYVLLRNLRNQNLRSKT